MSLLKLLLFSVTPINIVTFAQWNITTISAPSLPRKDSSQSIGHFNGTIYIFGGAKNQSSWIEYIIPKNTMIDRGINNLSFPSFSIGQYYTQSNDKLYWTSYNYIYSYDYILQTFRIDADVSSPKPGSCAALSSYNDLLFVLGGCVNKNATKAVQVFNTSSNTWITHIANLNRHRSRGASAVDAHRGVLYIIAGESAYLPPDNLEYRADFEAFEIEDDITQSQWILNQSKALDYASQTVRAVYVEYNDSILVVGGTAKLADISIIDCKTREVSSSVAELDYNPKRSAVILVDHVLYLFGGMFKDSSYDTWQRVTNPLIFGAPTNNATNEPTQAAITTTDISAYNTTAYIYDGESTAYYTSQHDGIVTSVFSAIATTNAYVERDGNRTNNTVLMLIVIILVLGIIIFAISAYVCYLLSHRKKTKAKDTMQDVKQTNNSQAQINNNQTSNRNISAPGVTVEPGSGLQHVNTAKSVHLDLSENKEAEGMIAIDKEGDEGADTTRGYATDAGDDHHWEKWNTIQTLNWILSIENGIFKAYEQVLTQEMVNRELRGKDLITLDMDDFISLGINTLEHRQLLKKNILKCSGSSTNDQSNNFEDEEPSIIDKKETRQKSAVKLQMIGANDNDIEKEDVILDQMLSDIVEMQNLDSNKIHQINVNNVVNQNNNDSDSDDSDHMYQNHK